MWVATICPTAACMARMPRPLENDAVLTAVKDASRRSAVAFGQALQQDPGKARALGGDRFGAECKGVRSIQGNVWTAEGVRSKRELIPTADGITFGQA